MSAVAAAMFGKRLTYGKLIADNGLDSGARSAYPHGACKRCEAQITPDQFTGSDVLCLATKPRKNRLRQSNKFLAVRLETDSLHIIERPKRLRIPMVNIKSQKHALAGRRLRTFIVNLHPNTLQRMNAIEFAVNFKKF